jgi:N-acetylglucosamine transport system permease protein
MLAAMGFWNEYPLALVMLRTDAIKTLPIGLAHLFEVQKKSTDFGALFAALVIVLIPTIAIYLIGQRNLLKGITAGGMKE